MSGNGAFIGRSQAIKDILHKAERLASIPRPLLIRGERGTGKELLASFIHTTSIFSAGPFIAINSSVYNDEILASELFGYEKGAFTGALSRHIGCLDRAHGGTLFFDEIGNMSIRFQEKLLRVLETKCFEPLGAEKSHYIDVRFIFATNANLESMIENGFFRPDFYDRIAFEILTLPPLRQRREDIPLLADYFTSLLIKEIPYIEPREFSPEALEMMKEYYWPGNVRELKNIVERLQLEETDTYIRTIDLPPKVAATTPTGDTFEEKVEGYRKHLIYSALRDSQFNQKRAALSLGMSYDQFRHYFRKYHLKNLSP
ncbi:MAG: sigma 54-interacting transcriptional regulator [bacterium]